MIMDTKKDTKLILASFYFRKMDPANCSRQTFFSLPAKLHFCPFLGWSIPGSLQDHDLLILFDFWWAFKNKVDQETSKEDLKDTHRALRSKCCFGKHSLLYRDLNAVVQYYSPKALKHMLKIKRIFKFPWSLQDLSTHLKLNTFWHTLLT